MDGDVISFIGNLLIVSVVVGVPGFFIVKILIKLNRWLDS